MKDLTLKDVTKEYLENIKYKDLKSEFENLGLTSAWKDGDNKSVLIKSALAIIAEVKESSKEVEIEKAKKEVEIKAKAKAKEEEEREEQAKKDLISKDYPREVIENALKNISENLRNGIDAQRPLLLKKKVQLEKLLESMD